jgi:DNA-binding response OmpR family regulator
MSTKKHTILIVEDDASLREALYDKLKHEGFTVLTAKNGQEGLQIALDEHPDLMLLDIVMPIMDGLVTLKKIREDNWGKNAKIIMLTNLSDNDKISAAVAEGSFEYIVKSDWKMEDVVKKIKAQLPE